MFKGKTRWDANPRGKLWTEDKNKYGQRMLEKMGWENGKGLGLEETGITEPVLVRFKADKKGFGQKGLVEDINPHLDEFDSFLSTLNKHPGAAGSSVNSEEKSSRGLEERARSSRKLFYHRFIKSKDVSRYSKKDMKCIFGDREKTKLSEEPELQTAEQFKKGGDGEVNSDHGTTTIHRGSMDDYFAKMLAAKKGKAKGTNQESTLQDSNKTEESETGEGGETFTDERVERKRKSKKSARKLSEDVEGLRDNSSDHEKRKRRKNKSLENELEVQNEYECKADCNDEQNNEHQDEELENSSKYDKKECKRRKKEKKRIQD